MTISLSSVSYRRLRCAATLAGLLAMAAPWPAHAGPVDEQKGAMARLHDIRDKAGEFTMQALSLIGIRYKYGGNEPDTGLDCSGLVRFAYKEATGKELPRTAREISQVGDKVNRDDLKPGDLVFYNTLRRGFSHVGIYLGDNKFIHAPSSGGEVRVESMDLAYWKKRFMGARRIDNDAATSDNASGAAASSSASASATASADKKS